MKLKSELDLSAKASTWSSAKTGVETAFPKCEKPMEKTNNGCTAAPVFF